ncbi:MAG: hypothetical protein HC794_04145 [Nitrospiraceae bacterium]|nr:hypothetical protein [Nitrospiraceae bacterium]
MNFFIVVILLGQSVGTICRRICSVAMRRQIAAGALYKWLAAWVVAARSAARATGSEAHSRGRGLAPAVVRLLVERGVRTFGTDAWSIDPPIARMKDRAAEFGAESVWAAHYVGRELEFCVLERLTNLALLPLHGFEVCCFPVKIAGASAAWVRAVAFLPGDPSRSSNPIEVVS